MTTSVTAIRIDSQLKESARRVLDREGITMTFAVEQLLRKVSRDGCFPREILERNERDYVGEYLAPIMNERYERGLHNVPLPRLRRRLASHRAFIYGGEVQ